MVLDSSNSLYRSENSCKEKVYSVFDKMRAKVDSSVTEGQKRVDAGSYEDQDAFTVFSDLSDAWQERHEVERLIQGIYKKPYFAHIRIREKGDKYDLDYYLSDSETLNKAVSIGKEGCLIPFKQDKKRPLSGVLFHCYQSKNGTKVSYFDRDGIARELIPSLICDDEIDNRKLLDAIQLFPEEKIAQIDADEYLGQQLEENRDNPELRNIISTLQQKQFQIISGELKNSFIVQGCAGSGKSQCLLHRLFYLRDELSDDGWKNILLLTPTQLFRNYSSDLIRRYQLTDIDNCSIAELYRKLLTVYDARFQSRQYQFELSEEYLPDGYLQEVYRPEKINKIDSEIENAIIRYANDGCTALGTEMPIEITSDYIGGLVELLDKEMSAYDSRETILKEDQEYVLKRKEYDELQKKLNTAQKNYERISAEKEQLEKDEEKLDTLIRTYQDDLDERNNWVKQWENEIAFKKKELTALERKLIYKDDISAPGKYAYQLFLVKNVTTGEKHKESIDYLKFLDTEYCPQDLKKLKEFTNNEKIETVRTKYEKKRIELLLRLEKKVGEIEILTKDIKDHSDWIRNKANELEGIKLKITLHRSDMERARYYLSRIESTIFEREVWNVLEPDKQKFNIVTKKIEELDDKHQRETRILYKSDLLFYLKIYAKLHPDEKLPGYHLLCIDEGQDLHRADYEMLRTLFPKAHFNIFGDTNQVLHTACGISSWSDETGIQTVYSLNRDYRNTAAIVDFCNSQFGEHMQYVGKIRDEQRPELLKNIDRVREVMSIPNIVFIVKDFKSFCNLCQLIRIDENQFEYLDTKTEDISGHGIPCYSVFAAKGLEFNSAVVYADQMTRNQKVVACTRAMSHLYYYE